MLVVLGHKLYIFREDDEEDGEGGWGKEALLQFG